MGDAEVLRSVHQPGNAAVCRAAARALLGHANQIARGVRRALEVAHAEEGAAESRLEQQPVRHRRRPRRLSDVQRPSEDADGFRRHRCGLGVAGSGAGTLPAQGLRVPEDADLVARRQLPGDPGADVLERPVRVLRPVAVGRVEPLGRPAGVQVVVHVAAHLGAAARLRVCRVPDAILHNRPTNRGREVVHLGQGSRRDEALCLQRRREVVRLQLLAGAAPEERRPCGVAARLGDDVHHQSGRFGFARWARGKRHFLRTAHVHDVARR